MRFQVDLIVMLVSGLGTDGISGPQDTDGLFGLLV